MEITWQVEDGYIGGIRPQTIGIELDEFEGMTPGEIEDEINAIIDEDFQSRISWSCQSSKYAQEIYDKLNK